MLDAETEARGSDVHLLKAGLVGERSESLHLGSNRLADFCRDLFLVLSSGPAGGRGLDLVRV